MPNLTLRIKKYAKKNPVRFHMPGHKGILSKLDVTELFFTDSLYMPDKRLRLISRLEEYASRVFFCRNDIKTTVSCGGATLCVQTALLALVRGSGDADKKRYIICERGGCHVSFINAAALLDIEPIWVNGSENIAGVFACAEDKNIIAVFVTSPDYYGNMRDIREISKICKEHKTPLITDNSHGSHLAFYNDLHPMNRGADISIDSVHKTLPALTGAALIHSAKNYDMRSAMRVFGSTSPSFLILSSIEKMLGFLELRGRAEHARLLYDINALKKNAQEYFPENHNLTDPYRIVLNCKGLGEKLYYFLFEQNITCEFYERDRVVIIPSVFNKSKDFKLLASALRTFALSNKIIRPPIQTEEFNISRTPECILTLSSAASKPRETVKTSAAPGRICAEPVFAYPPGIPVVLPGELIDAEICEIIKNLQDTVSVIK
ncbi:MAG: PLP-dependent transferase [Oscillospiraceae bacterium]|nr:PLP-dependent transferase [Oscillospiraceae bacterium]